MNLALAEQSTQQQQDKQLTEIILANVGTLVAFKSGSPADAKILQLLLTPYVETSELINLPAFNFYARLSALESREPISGMTQLPEKLSNKKTRLAVIKSSRRRF